MRLRPLAGRPPPPSPAGAAPALDWPVDMTPVDYVSEIIVASMFLPAQPPEPQPLQQRQPSAASELTATAPGAGTPAAPVARSGIQRVLHICHPRPLTLPQYFEALRTLGGGLGGFDRVQTVPYEEVSRYSQYGWGSVGRGLACGWQA